MSDPLAHMRRREIGAGIASAVVGLGVTALALALMNGGILSPPERDSTAGVTFEVAEKRKPPPTKPKPKTAPRKRAAAAAPMPALTAGLSGLDFGLPAFSGGMEGATEALLGDVGDVVMTEDTVDVPPRPAARTAPEYPVRARRDFITGYVTLSMLVGLDGMVQDVRVLEAEPSGVFEDAAIAAVRSWRFDPAMYQGRPVPVRARQTLRFELE